ncbi:MAG: Uncharacterized protein Greene071421_578 [Parcubacteria group bacterium Greene0714_21]|nr:MAG: Uncharacterized protein Greene071421_578 [Parcubacteria group bacterium Greene0714_21]
MFRLPAFSQLKKLPEFLSKKETAALLILGVCFVGSGFFLARTGYLSLTKQVPGEGGKIIEGMLGSPRFLNPVYGEANDADRDLVELLYAGLLTYDSKGLLVASLAESFQIKEDGKVFEIKLRENLRWSDGTLVSADDVVFTIKTLRDPKYKSPLRANWVGVEVEKVSENMVRFSLQEPYAPFVERLTVKIIPKHIWEEITPENFPLSPYNLKPVGAGPWRVAKIVQANSGAIGEIELIRNPFYWGKKPFLNSLSFRFFAAEEELMREAERGTVNNFSLLLGKETPSFLNKGFIKHTFSLPRYFALFFNLQSSTLKNKDLRIALSSIIDTEKLVQDLFGENGKHVVSPLLPETFGLTMVEVQKLDIQNTEALLAKQGYKKVDGRFAKIPQSTGGISRDLQVASNGEDVKKLQQCLAKDPQVYPDGTVSGSFGSLTKAAVIKFQEKYASEILAPQGLKFGTGKVGGATQEKLNELCFPQNKTPLPLKLAITTLNQYPLKDVAEFVKNEWEAFGVTTVVQTFSLAELERDIIKPRNYEALLFGEILGKIPDPFPFWHSSQVKDPGLNLSGLENKKLDSTLLKLRRESSQEKRERLLEEAQDILLEEYPALTLYDTPYLYFTSPQLKGIESNLISDPSERFAGVQEWYIKTKRVLK